MATALFDLALIIQMFVLVNPLSSVPVLMAAYKSKMNVKKIAVSAVGIAFVIAMIIAIVGPLLFNFFGITVDSFRIAGGIVLLLLGLDTIRSEDGKQKFTHMDSLISILATPLLTGPATISFITIKAYELGQIPLMSNLIWAFVLIGAVFVMFAFALPKINEKLVSISSKVLGLFLTAVAIEMIAKGVYGIFIAQQLAR
jgi:multiple antibiotic resistance protein